MEWFNKVAERHNEYLKMVSSFPENKDNDNIEDIVQDTYIELTQLGTKKHKEGDKRINPKYIGVPVSERVLNENGDGKVNMVFMWINLKRVSMSHLSARKKKAKYIQRLGEGFQCPTEEPTEHESSFTIMMDRIREEIEKWHWYDKMLFNTYIEDGKSMRQLSADTGISLTSIFTTLRNCKNRVKENVGEDFLDYMNKDYELIK